LIINSSIDIQDTELQGMLEIVDKAVGIERFAYPMYLNAPRPPVENYAAVRCRLSVNPGLDERKYTQNDDGTLTFKTMGIRILTFDILFVREGNEVVDFDNSFYRPDVKALMKRHGFAGPLLKMPTSLSNINLETNWEIRRGITCQFNVRRIQESIIGSISEVKVNGELFVDDENIKI